MLDLEKLYKPEVYSRHRKYIEYTDFYRSTQGAIIIYNRTLQDTNPSHVNAVKAITASYCILALKLKLFKALKLEESFTLNTVTKMLTSEGYFVFMAHYKAFLEYLAMKKQNDFISIMHQLPQEELSNNNSTSLIAQKFTNKDLDWIESLIISHSFPIAEQSLPAQLQNMQMGKDFLNEINGNPLYAGLHRKLYRYGEAIRENKPDKLEIFINSLYIPIAAGLIYLTPKMFRLTYIVYKAHRSTTHASVAATLVVAFVWLLAFAPKIGVELGQITSDSDRTIYSKLYYYSKYSNKYSHTKKLLFEKLQNEQIVQHEASVTL